MKRTGVVGCSVVTVVLALVLVVDITHAAWTYRMDSGYGIWSNGTADRFRYQYSTQQWYDRSQWSDWIALGSAGWSPVAVGDANPTNFIGDGALRNVGNGWAFAYSLNGDWSGWTRQSDGKFRFSYSYTPGQWATYSSLGAAYLGTASSTPVFLGDGTYRDVGNGWAFAYSLNGDWSGWTRQSDGKFRFSYSYTPGQWANYSSLGAAYLGAGGSTPVFLGDGASHTLGIWSYKFVNDIGYLLGSVSTWTPDQYGGGSWSSSSTQFTCNYAYQVFGLYDSGNISSVYRYDYNGGSSYNSKWEDWNYNNSNRSETSAAIVFYTGSSTHDVSSWLSWLPVNPRAGFITRTETWDFTNNDWANRYNHEARAFANNGWVVQRAQGSIGNCGIIASINAYEAATGIYAGQTQTWLDYAVAHGWAVGPSDPNNYGASAVDDNAYLMAFMGNLLGHPVTTSWNQYSISQLQTYLSQGYKVDVGVQLSYMPEFGASGGHALIFLGTTTVNGVTYAQITNGWNIQTGTTQTTGYDPNPAYPITLIPYSEFSDAYTNWGGWAAIVRAQ